MRLMKFGIVALSAVFAGACASTPIPVDKLSRAQGSVKTAHELNAERDPTAALHLRLAQEQLDRARKAIEDGDNDRASYLLMRAESDADVSVNLARQVAAKTEAQQTREMIQRVKAQMMEGSKS